MVTRGLRAGGRQSSSCPDPVVAFRGRYVIVGGRPVVVPLVAIEDEMARSPAPIFVREMACPIPRGSPRLTSLIRIAHWAVRSQVGAEADRAGSLPAQEFFIYRDRAVEHMLDCEFGVDARLVCSRLCSARVTRSPARPASPVAQMKGSGGNFDGGPDGGRDDRNAVLKRLTRVGATRNASEMTNRSAARKSAGTSLRWPSSTILCCCPVSFISRSSACALRSLLRNGQLRIDVLPGANEQIEALHRHEAPDRKHADALQGSAGRRRPGPPHRYPGRPCCG